MTELDDFIRRQLDHDEAQARAASARNNDQWTCPTTGRLDIGTDDFPIPTGDRDVAEHMARHDPKRVIIDCAARRAMLADILALEDNAYISSEEVERMLHLLAVPYVDREGYRNEWLIPHLCADWGLGQRGRVMQGELVRKELA
jgi:hypothetical protein